MGQFPSGNSNLLSILAKKGWQLIGQEAVRLMNEDFGPSTAGHEDHTTLQVGQHREAELMYKA
jgi:hypothetical protein